MKNCSFNDKLVAELETCQNNMTHFYYELVRPFVHLQIASEVVARGRSELEQGHPSEKVCTKKSRHHSIRL